MAYSNIYNKKLIDTLGGALGLLEKGKKSAVSKAGQEGATAMERLKKSLLRHTGGLSGATAQTLAKAGNQTRKTIGDIGLQYDTNKANQSRAINQFLSGQYNQNYNLGEQRKLTKAQMAQQANQFAQQLAWSKKQFEESKPKWYDYLLGGIGGAAQVAKAFF